MKQWIVVLAAGIVAVIGGVLALINPVAAGMTTATLAGWALLVVAALQGWNAWKTVKMKERIGAGLLAGVALFLSLSLLFGPFGDGGLMRLLVGLLLLASAGAKYWVSRDLSGSQNRPLLWGAAGVSALMGLATLLGWSDNFGTLVGVELLASGMTLAVLGLHRKAQPA